MEGIESRDDFFQLRQASITHSALKTVASDKDPYPIGREKTRSAGLKMNAAASRATVAVYAVPVDFCWESNIVTSSVPVVAKRRGSDHLT